MYSIIFLSCALTLALAEYSHHNIQHKAWIPYSTYNDHYEHNNNLEYNEHNKYHGPLHYPVINYHGVPVEPHEVQAARSQHLAAHSKESNHNSWIAHNTYDGYHQYNNNHEYNEHNKYHGPLHYPVINHHGVPVEPHAVQAARSQHLAVYSKESTHNNWTPHNTNSNHHQYNNHHEYNEHNKYHGPLHIPVINHHGVPVEPHAVQAARAQHLAAHNKGHGSYHGQYNHYRKRRGLGYNDNSYNSYNNYNDDNSYDNYDNYNDVYQNNNQQEYNEHNKYHGPIHIPVIGPHGVPVEPKEVQAARAHHLAAHSDASAHSSWNSHDDNNQYNGDYQHNNRQEYNEHNKYHGPIHIPVIGPHGVPVETPEVQAARAQHLASHNKFGGLYQGAQYNSHYNHASGHYSYGSGASQGYHHY